MKKLLLKSDRETHEHPIMFVFVYCLTVTSFFRPYFSLSLSVHTMN